MEIVGIEIETEKEVVGDDREDMVAGDAVTVGVVEAEFDDWVSAAGPGERGGDLVKNDIYRFGYSLDHAPTI